MISSDTVQSTAQTWKEHKPRENLDTFAEAEGLIENSNVVAKNLKDKLTLLDTENDMGTLASVSTLFDLL